MTRLKGAFSLANLYFWDSAASGVCSQRQFCIQLPCTSFYVGNDCNCPLFIKSEAEVMGGKWLGPLLYENNKVSKMGGSLLVFFLVAPIQCCLPKRVPGTVLIPKTFTLLWQGSTSSSPQQHSSYRDVGTFHSEVGLAGFCSTRCDANEHTRASEGPRDLPL